MRKCQLLQICILLFLNSFLSAQKIQRTILSVEEGLSHRNAFEMVKDRDGFLWIATENGLNRYDGYQFIHYNNQLDNPNKIGVNWIWRLFLTQEGHLLLYNEKEKIELLNLKSNLLSKIDYNKPTEEQSAIRAFHQSPDGAIFLITENDTGFYVFEYKNKTFELLFKIQEHRSRNPILNNLASLRFHFFRDLDGVFWILDQEKGLRCFDAQGKLIRQFSTADFENMEDRKHMPNKLNFLIKDKQQRIWLSFGDLPGLYQYHPEKGQFELSKNFNQQLYYTFAKSDEVGNVLFLNSEFLGRPNAAWLLDTSDVLHNYIQYMDYFGLNVQIFGEDFKELFYQLSGAGVRKIHIPNTLVKGYLNKDLQNGDIGINIRGITEDKAGNIIIGTGLKGWFYFDRTKEMVQPVSFDDLDKADLKPSVASRNFVQDKEGFLWNSAYQEHVLPEAPRGYLLKYNPENQKVKYYVSPHRIENLTISHLGLFWLPGIEAVLIFDPKTEQFSQYENKDGTNPLKGKNTFYVLECKNRLIWIGTDEGLVSIDPQKKESVFYNAEGQISKNDSLQFAVINIYEHENGNLWLGTLGNGLKIFNPITNSMKSYTNKDGLSNNNVCGIIKDNSKNYWISTYYGLNYFDEEKQIFRNFFEQDGFNHNEFNRFAFFKDSQGLLYFGGINGFNVFKAEDLLIRHPPDQLFLSQVTFFDKERQALVSKTNDLQHLKAVTLPAENRYFHLQFGISDYRRPESNRFAYYLEGYDQDWRQIGNVNEVIFNNLPAGEYFLHLKAANYRGEWTEKPFTIKVRVKEFFYKTWWFSSTVFLLILLSIYLFYQYRLQQLKKLLDLRTKIASDLHDDVGGILTSVAMQMEILELSKGNPNPTKIAQIRELSQHAIYRMRDVVWSIDARRDTIGDLIDRMREHSAATLEPKGIKYKIETFHLDDEKKLPITIRQNLYLIFKEAVTNTVRHSEATEFSVSLKKQSSGFEMCIRDNGKGIDLNKKASGLGLSNIRMRAEQIGAKVEFLNQGGLMIVLRMSKF